MAVNKYFILSLRTSLNYNMMNHLTNSECFIMLWYLQILPEQIEILDSGIHKCFWRVGEPRSWNYTVRTIWMLARLLQIYYCFYTVVFELLDYIEFLDKSIRRSLGAHKQSFNPFGV